MRSGEWGSDSRPPSSVAPRLRLPGASTSPDPAATCRPVSDTMRATGKRRRSQQTKRVTMNQTTITITAASPEDYPALLTLNEGAVPAVNSIPQAKLEHLHSQSAYLGVARVGREAIGFLLAMPESADYDSINFGYFRRHYPGFCYVDRVVVSPAARRAGIGTALYADLERAIGSSRPLLACEVNIRPSNPESLAFHQRLGFEAVGEQDTEGGNKRVCLMTKSLAATAPGAAPC
jgi:uncharacterized protein